LRVEDGVEVVADDSIDNEGEAEAVVENVDTIGSNEGVEDDVVCDGDSKDDEDEDDDNDEDEEE
jgi:hypothetical protein